MVVFIIVAVLVMAALVGLIMGLIKLSENAANPPMPKTKKEVSVCQFCDYENRITDDWTGSIGKEINLGG